MGWKKHLQTIAFVVISFFFLSGCISSNGPGGTQRNFSAVGETNYLASTAGISLSIATQSQTYNPGEAVKLTFGGKTAPFAVAAGETGKNLEKQSLSVIRQSQAKPPIFFEENIAGPKAQLFDLKSANDRAQFILSNGIAAKINGTLTALVYDDFANQRSETQFFIESNSYPNTVFRAFFNAPQMESIGKVVEANGVLLGDEIVPIDYQMTQTTLGQATEETSTSPNIGVQRVAVLLIAPDGIMPESKQDVFEKFFDANKNYSINSYVKEASFQKAFLEGDVFGWYPMPSATNFCSLYDIVKKAIAAADNEADFSKYSRISVVLGARRCNFSGVGSIGTSRTFETNDGIITVSTNLLNGAAEIDDGTGSHEFGHNFGLFHAGDFECGSKSTGENCAILQYGDIFDIMGASGNHGHFNAYHKEKAGWLLPSDTISLSKTNFGTYAIAPIEKPNQLPIAAKIDLDGKGAYYIEYRRPLGYDKISHSFYGPPVFNGAMIHFVPKYMQSGADSFLLDNSPHDNFLIDHSTDSIYAVLEEGQLFEDYENRIKIKALSAKEDKLVFSLNSAECGNGEVDGLEECDLQSFRKGFSCQNLGFKEGTLECTPFCTVSANSCDNLACSFGDFWNGITCEKSFSSSEQDGFIVGRSENSWDQARKMQTGTVYENNYIMSEAFSASNPPQFILSRASIPFDTTALDDNAILKSAALKLQKIYAYNSHPQSVDFLAVVPANLKQPPQLINDDFARIGPGSNPVQLSLPADVSESGEKVDLNLTQNGLYYINKAGITALGLLTGYDFNSSTPNNGELTMLNAVFSSANAGRAKPTLFVKYNLPPPPNSFIQNNGSIDITGLLTIKIQKLSAVQNQWIDVGNPVYQNELAVPAQQKLSLPYFLRGNNWIALGEGKHRVAASFLAPNGQLFEKNYEFLIIPFVCGNGKLEAGEQCDEGKNNSNDLPNACRANCQYARCGDGAVDAGEECDDGNLNNGDGCNSTCNIEPPFCNPGDTLNPDRTCTATFYSLKGDGYVGYRGASSWPQARNNISGNIASFSGQLIIAGAENSSPENAFSLHRGFFPFDTNSIPDKSEIINATLTLKITTYANTDTNFFNPQPNDFFVIVLSFQPSEKLLSVLDYTQVGSAELSNRKIILNVFPPPPVYSFILNETGINAINKSGFTKLAIRTGYDLLDVPINNGKKVESGFSSSENPREIEPRLTIAYRPA